MKGIDFMNSREKMVKIAETIMALYNSVYESDWDGLPVFTEDFEKMLPTEEHDTINDLKKQNAQLQKEIDRLGAEVKARTHQVMQLTEEKIKLKQKLSKALTNNIKMCEHIKELHKKSE